MSVNLHESTATHIFSPVYFLASKIEAFKSRGRNDGRWSTEFEDIIQLLNNQSSIWLEVGESGEPAVSYLREEIKAILKNKYLDEQIGCHLELSEPWRRAYYWVTFGIYNTDDDLKFARKIVTSRNQLSITKSGEQFGIRQK